MEDHSVIALRRRTIIGGTLLWVVFLGLTFSALVLEGGSLPLVLASTLALVAGGALFSVLLSVDISVAGYPLDPFQRASLGYVLLAAAVGLVYAPRASVGPGVLVPLSWIALLVGLATWEASAPRAVSGPSMRQVGLIVALTLGFVVALPLGLSVLG
ncbi:hypothetical protein C479_08433 [Halovivax asiaticus JCM 14624]|uniref:Uncharacterized protein n=1 Tax=Halovivax asiaticus JCM 14624 TaxID=1227490 RepID=M0BMG4_9EURY|nr:hypothetical protein [Halovivax asiaticus]ELZ10824.1 hypothetical protein C479_08433 [Halovivax asiaticus JCM 14624]